MSGKFTRKMYDGCAFQQNLKQSTDPLEHILDLSKYVNYNNICRPVGRAPQNAAQLVDIESSLMGIDKTASYCDSGKHPFCGSRGCLLTKDPRVAPFITPYACERGYDGENAVITTNIKSPRNPGYTLPGDNKYNGYKQVVPNVIFLRQ